MTGRRVMLVIESDSEKVVKAAEKLVESWSNNLADARIMQNDAGATVRISTYSVPCEIDVPEVPE